MTHCEWTDNFLGSTLFSEAGKLMKWNTYQHTEYNLSTHSSLSYPCCNNLVKEIETMQGRKIEQANSNQIEEDNDISTCKYC